MTVHRHIDNDDTHHGWHEEEDTDTLAYIGSLPELMEAGLGGFSIRHIDQMPEHESEFVPASSLRTSGIDEDLRAIEEFLAQDVQRRHVL